MICISLLSHSSPCIFISLCFPLPPLISAVSLSLSLRLPSELRLFCCLSLLISPPASHREGGGDPADQGWVMVYGHSLWAMRAPPGWIIYTGTCREPAYVSQSHLRHILRHTNKLQAHHRTCHTSSSNLLKEEKKIDLLPALPLSVMQRSFQGQCVPCGLTWVKSHHIWRCISCLSPALSATVSSMNLVHFKLLCMSVLCCPYAVFTSCSSGHSLRLQKCGTVSALTTDRTVLHTHLEPDSVSACQSNSTQRSLFTGIPPCRFTRRYMHKRTQTQTHVGMHIHMCTHSKKLTFFWGGWHNQPNTPTRLTVAHAHMQTHTHINTQCFLKRNYNHKICKHVPSYFTVNHKLQSYILLCHLVLLGHPQSSRVGPACSISVSSLSSSFVGWQDHLVLLPVARFGIILHNNGPKDCLDQSLSQAARGWSASCPSETVALLPIMHTRMHGHSGTMLLLNTFKLLINMSLCLWPSSSPKGSQSLRFHVLTIIICAYCN